MKQRRLFSRVLFNQQAKLFWDGQHTRCEVCDLSLKGALLRIPAGASLTPGQTARFEVQLNGGDLAIRMEGVVAHQHESVLGLHCTRIDIDSITHLRRLLELNRGDESDLQRELQALTTL